MLVRHTSGVVGHSAHGSPRYIYTGSLVRLRAAVVVVVVVIVTTRGGHGRATPQTAATSSWLPHQPHRAPHNPHAHRRAPTRTDAYPCVPMRTDANRRIHTPPTHPHQRARAARLVVEFPRRCPFEHTTLDAPRDPRCPQRIFIITYLGKTSYTTRAPYTLRKSRTERLPKSSEFRARTAGKIAPTASPPRYALTRMTPYERLTTTGKTTSVSSLSR